MKQTDLKELFDKKGFKFFERGMFNLNIFGVRHSSGDTNRFKDLICIAYKNREGWQTFAMDATTSPSSLVLGKKIGTEKGTAILPVGQYRMMIGTHKGYEALVQAEKFTVIRDKNKDNELTFDGELDTGWFGINLHHASEMGTSKFIGMWSIGCQVIASIKEWKKFWKIVKKSSKIFGKYFTYSLFDEKDLNVCIHDFKDIMNNNSEEK